MNSSFSNDASTGKGDFQNPRIILSLFSNIPVLLIVLHNCSVLIPSLLYIVLILRSFSFGPILCSQKDIIYFNCNKHYIFIINIREHSMPIKPSGRLDCDEDIF